MDTKFPHRTGLVVWFYTPKYINKLKRYGLLHYVSRKMNYAILYVNKKDVESTKETLLKQHFVREVEDSYKNDLTFEYDGVLEEVRKLSQRLSEETDEGSSLSLFEELSGQGGFAL